MKKTKKKIIRKIKPITKPATNELMIYKVILEMAGNKYEGEGETLFDAMYAIKLEWHDIKAKGVFTIIHGTKKCEKLFYLPQLKRIFANDMVMRLWAKRLELFLIETA